MIENVAKKRLVAFQLLPYFSMCVFACACLFFLRSLLYIFRFGPRFILVLFIVTLKQLHHIHAKYLNCCAYFSDSYMQHIVRPSNINTENINVYKHLNYYLKHFVKW